MGKITFEYGSLRKIGSDEVEHQTGVLAAILIAIVAVSAVAVAVAMPLVDDDREDVAMISQPEVDVPQTVVPEPVAPVEPEPVAPVEPEPEPSPSEQPIYVFYDVVVKPAEVHMGDAYGTGTYEKGTKYTISAVPAQGYAFLSWDDGNTEARRTVDADSERHGSRASSRYTA